MKYLVYGGGGGSRASPCALFSATYRFYEVNNVPKVDNAGAIVRVSYTDSGLKRIHAM